MRRVRTGLEEFIARPRDLRGKKVGLIANPTAVTPDLVHAALALKGSSSVQLTTLFGPEHGVWADAQDLVEVGETRDPGTGLRVHSLYGKTRVPTKQMLRGLDALLFDVQDVGARYYTFISTMWHAMHACARDGCKLVILDRPNPLGGVSVQGNVLKPSFESFVGIHPIATRHGLTVAEIALMLRSERNLDVDLRIVKMEGWKREMMFEDTGLPWIMPSPNMPTLDTALVYPGACLVEGTNLSEGRGTTRPFELVGAPWLDPWKLDRDLDHYGLPGVRFRPVFFRPTFQKHAGQLCGGVQVHVRNRRLFQPFLTYVTLIQVARRQNPKRFAWRQPPYEYELEKLPFDILCGTDEIRLAMEAGRLARHMVPIWTAQIGAFKLRRKPFLLY
jgi:uncharacterized protein YbbC (DUF1343 family)